MGGLTRLRALHLKSVSPVWNASTAIEVLLLSNLTDLNFLSLAVRARGSLPCNMVLLHKLAGLECYGAWRAFPAMRQLTALRTLRISSVKAQIIGLDDITTLPELRELDLTGCGEVALAGDLNSFMHRAKHPRYLLTSGSMVLRNATYT